MKKFILIVILVFQSGCVMIKGHYMVWERDGRLYLKDMEFKKSFNENMASLIDEDAIYIFEADESNEYGQVMRFFKTGQYVIVQFHVTATNEYKFDQLNRMIGKPMGYYNSDLKNNILVIEEADRLSEFGYRKIRKYKVMQNGDLKNVNPYKGRFSSGRGFPYYKKIVSPLLIKVEPYW